MLACLGCLAFSFLLLVSCGFQLRRLLQDMEAGRFDWFAWVMFVGFLIAAGLLLRHAWNIRPRSEKPKHDA